jgi:hypothetical protein
MRDGASSPSSPSLPASFEFYIGGSVGPSLYVRLVDDGRLLYEWASAGGYSGVVMEASPTGEEWAQFRETAGRLGVWEWEPEYVSAYSCCDVTYWHLSLEMDGHSIVARGANAYPGSPGPEVSKQFREFRAAVERLIGRGSHL